MGHQHPSVLSVSKSFVYEQQAAARVTQAAEASVPDKDKEQSAGLPPRASRRKRNWPAVRDATASHP